VFECGRCHPHTGCNGALVGVASGAAGGPLWVEPPRSRVRAGRSGFRRILVVRARPGGPLKALDV